MLTSQSRQLPAASQARSTKTVEPPDKGVPGGMFCEKVIWPGLGMQVAPDQLARSVGAPGVIILGVQPDSPAAKAGLRPTRRDNAQSVVLGDVIVAIDGHKIQTVKDLFSALAQHDVGSTVTVTVLRDGKEEKLEIVMASLE